MATLLLIVIYLFFIGLGLPDSVFGSCWPSIKNDFSLPVSYANYVSVLVAFFTFCSSMLSPKIVKRTGTGGITVVSTFATAVALLGFSLSNKFIYLILLTIPLGFGAGAIDSALNNYVAVNYKASQMSFLHCFYGIGVFLSPIIMGIALKNTTWHSGYRYICYIQFVIALISLLALPLWKKRENSEEVKSANGIKDVFKIKPMRVGLFIFTCSCAVEFLCGNWGATYLVGVRNLSPSISATSMGIYYLGMTLGRLVSGFLSKKMHGFKIIATGFISVAIGIVLLILPLSYYFGIAGLFLIGLGNGPVFPNMTHLTPVLYGKQNSQAIISLQMGFCYIGSTLVPFIFGYVAEKFLGVLPFVLLFFFAMTVLSFFLLNVSLKKEKTSKNELTKTN